MGSQDMSSSSTLVVKKSQVIIVKPSKPTPDVSLSLSTLDNDPYIETRSKVIYVYAPPSTNDVVQDPASLFQKALSDAIVYYYPLAGKLHRRSHDQRLELMCSPDDGVPFVKATADCTLSSLNYLEDTDSGLDQLVLCDDIPVTSGGYDPLTLQITLFACGGFTLATTLSHSLCDGFGASQFYKALTEFAAGKTQPSIIPVWDRHCLTFKDFKGKVEKGQEAPKLVDFVEACASVATSPYTPSNEMVCEILNVTSEEITQLKEKVPGEEVTTLEVLSAHLWRERCRALKLRPDGISLFGITVGIRRIMDPPLSEGYYGNAFVKANVVMKAEELHNAPLAHIVKLIKKVKRESLDMKYVHEQLRDTERTMTTKVVFEGGHGAFTFLTDWRQLGLLDEVDFGYGGSKNIVPLVPTFMSDICMFLPSKHGGGVKVLVTLPKPAMDNLKEHFNILSF